MRKALPLLLLSTVLAGYMPIVRGGVNAGYSITGYGAADEIIYLTNLPEGY